MKRICHVIPFFYPQFAAPYEYTQILAREGYQVDVVALQRVEEPDIEEQPNLSIYRVNINRANNFKGMQYQPFISFAGSLIKEFQYDLIHVYAFRGCGFLPFQGRKHCAKWVLDIRTGNVSQNAVVAYVADKLTALESTAYTHYIALDERVGEKVLGQHRNFHVVSVGADVDKFQPLPKALLREKLNLPLSEQLIVYVGSLHPRRRPENLLYAFAKVNTKSKPLRLVIIGDDDALPRLRELAKKLDIAERVLFLGYIPYDQIPEYTAACDIGFAYVPNIPQFRYQPPLKTAEFLACGLPTIATNTEGNLHFVTHEENGLVVADDTNELAKAIQRIVEEPNLFTTLQNSARSSALQHDWTHIVSTQLIPFYKSILASSQNHE